MQKKKNQDKVIELKKEVTKRAESLVQVDSPDDFSYEGQNVTAKSDQTPSV